MKEKTQDIFLDEINFSKDEIIQMALSDDVFTSIKNRFGLSEHEVKKLMRKSISPKSYRRWRKRVRRFF